MAGGQHMASTVLDSAKCDEKVKHGEWRYKEGDYIWA